MRTHVARTCANCGAPIEYEPVAGWIDKRSGDVGGTYDYCPAGQEHQPRYEYDA
jgi:hypothetical protein